MTRSSRDPQTRRRRLLWLVGLVSVPLALVLVAGGAGVWIWDQARESLPRLDGEVAVDGLTAPVVVDRDAAGVPVLRGKTRTDVAWATGFVHAQERFFQMDLLRRRAAGETAELLGEVALETDLALRRHRLRERADRALQAASPEIRTLLEAYAQGVNAGLADLETDPFEYAALRTEPRPWTPEDSVLVWLSLFAQLEDLQGDYETFTSLMRDRLPEPLVDFLLPVGTSWDAPMVGEPLATPPVPESHVVDLRGAPAEPVPAARKSGPPRPRPVAASNALAVAGARTTTGSALLACDLHQGLSLPNVWYRLSLDWLAPPEEATGPDRRWHVTGASLPGLPLVLVGSNEYVAWGVTNSSADTTDVVLLEVSQTDPGTYSTPSGPRRFERFTETFRVGDEIRRVDLEWTVWGPRIGPDAAGRPRALRSVIHEPGGVDLEILHLETARDVEEAVTRARRSGTPSLDLLVADRYGDIAWTVVGRLPRRIGFDGRFATSWADGSRRWDGLLPPEDAPGLVHVEPPQQVLWSANQRPVDGRDLERLGYGNYVLGARAAQLHAGLTASPEKLDVEDLRLILLDDRAVFLTPWRDFLLSVLTPEAVAEHPGRRELRDVLAGWQARAAVDAVGYRMVYAYRFFLGRRLFDALTGPCRQADPEFDYTMTFLQFEGPLHRLVRERPEHLLPPPHESWHELFLSVADEIVDFYGTPLSESPWGERNTVRMQHPFSRALPVVDRWLDMPTLRLPGSDDMPRLQAPDYGSTLRMAVSPGRESEGFLHMPGGQSGNPASPHYGDGHRAWARGDATPFLPGTAAHSLRLIPAHRETP